MPKHYKIKKSTPFDETSVTGSNGKVEHSKESDFSNGKKKMTVKKSTSSMSPSEVIEATKVIRTREQRKKGLKIAPTKQKDLSKQFNKSLEQEKGRKPQSVSAKSDKAQNVFRPASKTMEKSDRVLTTSESFAPNSDEAKMFAHEAVHHRRHAERKAVRAGNEIDENSWISIARAANLKRTRKKKD